MSFCRGLRAGMQLYSSLIKFYNAYIAPCATVWPVLKQISEEV